MSWRRTSVLVGAVALTAVGMASPAAAALQPAELLPLAGHTHSLANDISDNNVVAGESYAFSGNSTHKAVTWDSTGAVTELPSLPGSTADVAAGNNNHGFVVGSSGSQAARWTPKGDVAALLSPPGAIQASAAEINDNNVVAGNARYSDGSERAIRWYEGRTPEELPSLADSFGRATSISLDGTVVGFSGSSPVRWLPDGSISLLPVPAGTSYARANGINTQGVIVGYFARDNELPRGLVWNPDGTFYELGALPGGKGSIAEAINDSGIITGYAQQVVDGSSSNRAVQWVGDSGVLIDLGILPGHLGGSGLSINSAGQAVGFSGSRLSIRATRWS